MYVRGYLQCSENGRVATIALLWWFKIKVMASDDTSEISFSHLSDNIFFSFFSISVPPSELSKHNVLCLEK